MEFNHIPADTKLALKEVKLANFSRSLYFDRFAKPEVEKQARNHFFAEGFKAQRCPERTTAWSAWTRLVRAKNPSVKILFGQLQARLIMNMAGGVMENAGLCLDRFGIPYIPGSAVKGCARRVAIQRLLEMRQDNAQQETLTNLLADIALTFGWGEQDWLSRADFLSVLHPKRGESDMQFAHRRDAAWQKGRSDFAYAIGDSLWPAVVASARRRLPAGSHFAGAIGYLPAYPLALPQNDLELDVLTCHHSKYYRGDGMPKALDTEEPNPVVFPAVAAGMQFQFTILPVKGSRVCFSQPRVPLQELAVEWLRHGLETFGLGAKTAAGYGWSNASEAFNLELANEEALKAAEIAREMQVALETERRKKDEAERARIRAEENSVLSRLSPDQQEDYKLSRLTQDQFRAKLDNFLTNSNTPEKQAIVRALRLAPPSPNARQTFWTELKDRAAKKGGKFARIEEAIRQISREMKLGKMP